MVAESQSFFLFARGYHDGAEYGSFSPPNVELEGYSTEQLSNRQKHSDLLHLVKAYRRCGHLASNLDPLGMQKKELIEELSAGMYGLTEESKAYNLDGIIAPSKDFSAKTNLSAIIQALQRTYCRNISYEFEHVTDPVVRKWFAEYVESLDTHDLPSRYQRFHELMARAEVFELFLQKKLPNVKRYGLEGSESILVLLDQLIYEGYQAGITNVVAGLSHRGRQTILTGLFGYPVDEVFRKLQGGSEFPNDSAFTGDMHVDLSRPGVVSYPDSKTPISIDVVSNACHLESGMPVAMGKSRVKDINLARFKSAENHTIGDNVLPIALHGDSSFAGQGIVAESLAMSGLAHFTNGGTIHVVINNQVGYTTPASHTRSTRYASDIAKFADIPIIHVNGEHPEEVARAARIAAAYRQKFRKDVVVDVWTFRRRGHNEMDEPSFTQPAMYKAVNSRKSIPRQFEDKLIASGVTTKDDVGVMRKAYTDLLNDAFARSLTCNPTERPQHPRWKLLGSSRSYPVEKPTGVDIATLREVGIQSVKVDGQCRVHPRIERFHIKPRLKKLQDGHGIDWATAEALAFGTLVKEGYNVRLCGQDVGRGTFSQRHAMFVCQETEQVYVPFNHVDNGKTHGRLEVVNSNLCEEAVVGFEYGVAVEDPFTLAVWEAQFGDFYNNSQTIVDGYVASGETKWGQQNGLVMLLPHGFDGGGPDHSSCRIERHLLLSNDPLDGSHTSALPNLYVAYPSTPAQFFHLMRRQMKRNFRKPLIVAGPKTLLRLAAATSSLAEMGPGTHFQPVLSDPDTSDPRPVRRVMICSGKIYYDLAKLRSEHPLGEHVAILRVEELSPFPRNELYQAISQYANASDFVWVQEEPKNAGAYAFIAPRIKQLLPEHAELRYVGREEYAATCSGVDKQQAEEHVQLTRGAFEGLRGLVADLVIDNTAIHCGQQQQQQQINAPPAAVISAGIPHRWSSSGSGRMYAAQSSDQ
ncbi:dehydrogenase E1 and transketolase domain-containing protein 1 [Martensiomyces pterosporus]|nr:dehydrogenase E1 and transketolase domain-containing protein 1 [Martensiomyces pterosporus]